MSRLEHIKLDEIRVNPVALRDVNRDSEAFMQLVQSVKDEGVLNAINVREKRVEPDDQKRYELVDGLQRFTASQEAGSGVRGQVGVIPAQIIEREEAETLITQIVANAHKIETRPVEYARGLMRILGYNPTMSVAQLATKLNKSPQWVDRQLGLLKLNDSVKPLVDQQKISVTAAFSLAKLPKEEQLDWVERAQTMDVNEFSTQALERVKQIRDANRRGQDAGEEQFVAVPHLRKKKELEDEVKQVQVASELIRSTEILKDAKDLTDAAVRGFNLAIKWALQLDEMSVAKSKADWEARKKKADDDKVRRDAEKQRKRAEELEKKQAEAKANAEAARVEAEKRGIKLGSSTQQQPQQTDAAEETEEANTLS